MKHYQTKKLITKKKEYIIIFERVRDEIGEDNTAASVYTLLILTKEIKGVNGKTKMAIKQCFI